MWGGHESQRGYINYYGAVVIFEIIEIWVAENDFWNSYFDSKIAALISFWFSNNKHKDNGDNFQMINSPVDELSSNAPFEKTRTTITS